MGSLFKGYMIARGLSWNGNELTRCSAPASQDWAWEKVIFQIKNLFQISDQIKNDFGISGIVKTFENNRRIQDKETKKLFNVLQVDFKDGFH